MTPKPSAPSARARSSSPPCRTRARNFGAPFSISPLNALASGVVFFPMHRIERMELDLPEGNLLSLAQRFAEKTGKDPAPLLVSEFLASSRGTTRAEFGGDKPR